MKIIFVVNVDWFFISHRLPLANEALKRNYQVYVIGKDTGRRIELEKLGITFISLNFERAGKNPFKEILLIGKLRKIYKEIQPDVVHHITLKPAIYGTIAAKSMEKKVSIINAVSGLGYTFTNDRQSMGRTILLQLMKWAFKDQKSKFIFQNPDDRDLYKELGFLNSENSTLIKGSGVDGDEFNYCPPVEKSKLTVVLLARMLKDKGIIEFLTAAELLKNELNGKVEFLLVGGIDLENPAHINENDLMNYCDNDYIIWLGFSSNVKGIYENADIICLPSYREGLPKSLVEGMAIGRPIITTDAIGCRECVEDGVNGFLVPIKDSKHLAEKIKTLVDDQNLRLRMGHKSREKMLREMSLPSVIKNTFEFYEV